MFKINSDPKDKFQPIVLRDWSKGYLADIDPYDAPRDSLAQCTNLRYLPGQLTHIGNDTSEEIDSYATQTSWYHFFHQSSIDDTGASNLTNFYYWYKYQSATAADIRRAWKDGTWDSETIGSFTTINGGDKLFQAYGDIIDVAQEFYGPTLNIQYITRNRFLDNETFDNWATSESGTLAPIPIIDQDSGFTLNASIDSVVTTLVVAGGTHSWVAGDWLGINNEIMRITNVASSNLTVVRGERNTSAASHTAGDTLIAKADDDYLFTTPTLNVACQEMTLVAEDTVYKAGDELEYAISFIRDGIQESALVETGVTCTVTSPSLPGQLHLAVQDDDTLDRRITAIRVYHRLNGGEWYFLVDIDMDDGQDSTVVHSGGDWAKYWRAEQLMYNITVSDSGDNDGYTFTYFQKSGFPLDNQSTDIMYKVALTTGNRRIVGDVKKNGIEYPGRIYVSVPGQVNTFPDNNYLDLIEDDQSPFTALYSWNRILFAFKENEMYIIDIRPPNEAAWKVLDTKNIGVPGPDAVCEGPDGLFFATNEGIYKYDGGFKNITDTLISSAETDWASTSTKLGYDYTQDELVIKHAGAGGTNYVYDKYGRWWDETFGETSSYRFLNNENKELCYIVRDAPAIDLITRGTGSAEKLITMKTHPIRIANDDRDFIIRKIRVRFTNADSGSFTLQAYFDDKAAVQLAAGTGTMRGTTGDHILEWTGKQRCKTFALRFLNPSANPVNFKEAIVWVTPRKGRKNA
jgi:hypothetical protein